ncbi:MULTISPECIES: poly-beta-1,6-N-acetyl-D-glucosamine synthase [Enterobacter]|jgi:biofilm PGA synthesis N-glycosyltransferase PgaC|uniref:poly-beta-1,6-N-acetyl-D-glucosamine synthase n=1 Tax=Enterobacter TaxID=547 RepID=UPI00102EEAB6|nr:MULTISPECIES: poly-beta-1,6-N-acetyl-D-glucosamine synthase [Enterobacter]EKY1506188.1 poly-beta-1,6 N-acetyl-D-glucosamine synthase [Enterobacter cloacae]ELK7546874.1 poly-beta-1,6 N-acetyl-D-glucosamine synthase [Enterobacter cloacae]VAX70071.1 poly-beta-1,6-N-acetyl-D-glucosamine synthase [Enterobacter cloacae]HCK7298483.1 poly-beta-1,6 N-acetyl-D-glucosamine synthase [Enterobacter cloacae]HCT7576768.1 poly-beta-1,6 N-acetyl-D-glucosamine synthase [Enterobacter cloacae]
MNNRYFSIVILILVLCIPVGLTLLFSAEVMLRYVFFWPFFMSIFWIAGSVFFWFYRERHWEWGKDASVPMIKDNPLISIVIPCFNESKNIQETIAAAMSQRYDNFEVIAVNDGSSDDTGFQLNMLAERYPRLRVVHLMENQGKAIALKSGAAAAKGEFLVCIDGDACLDRDAAAWLVAPMIDNPRVGAVTGNPRIRTRSTLIGKVQVGEFSSIIGLIKRTQRVYGQVFTVSGVIAAFRRSALADVGYWSDDMITEDIDISWKLQLRRWSVFYEPRALCWILMPETLRGLWKQRLRWAKGGAEVFLKNMSSLWRWKHRHMWPLFMEYCATTAWAFTCLVSGLVILAEVIQNGSTGGLSISSVSENAGVLLCSLCLVQFLVSILIEYRYEHNVVATLFWIIWYPIIFWLISLFTTLVAFTVVMLNPRSTRARWVSPDRGIARG